MHKGIAASTGIGIGRAVIIDISNTDFDYTVVSGPESEKERLYTAFDKFIKSTEQLAEKIKLSVSEHDADILMSHISIVNDPAVRQEIELKIQSGLSAVQAVEQTCDSFIEILSGADDELIRNRATDISDVKSRLIAILLGKNQNDLSHLPENTVLVVEDLTPSMTVSLDKNNVAAIVTERGGMTSHSAILSRALGIPAVLSVENCCSLFRNHEELIVDGYEGIVINSYDQNTYREYLDKRDRYVKEKAEYEKYIDKPTVTADGMRLVLYGNIATVSDAEDVIKFGGEGVGLFRTEFLYMNAKQAPDEDKQYTAYMQAAEMLKDKPMIIRTLDVGGDKNIEYLKFGKEDNPFLGFRGIRFCLKNRDLYMTQLRALMKASVDCELSVMIPLVTGIDELREVKQLIGEIQQQQGIRGAAHHKKIKVGVMIETPAAVLMADWLAQEADFFSIGTNDLTQYLLAVDRGNQRVSYLYSYCDPSVLRSIQHVIKCAHKEGIPVGMCGEAASDRKMIPLLIAFGLTEFSVTPTAIPKVRKAIANWNKDECDAVARNAMKMKTAAEVENYLKSVEK